MKKNRIRKNPHTKSVSVRGVDDNLWWEYRALCTRRHESVAEGLMRLMKVDLAQQK